MFEFKTAGNRLFAAVSAFGISTLVMAFAIIPASPTGVIA
ncbi:MAG: recombination protein F [Erythrobacter sp.]|jgi:hypothetical protein|nr:recombination protein F [Erythrobacter sp.]RZV32576.1 MAG: recombination protein F [Sphingomonadaceae bacterium]